MKLALNGCLGKMGRRIAEIALAQGHSLAALIDAQGGGKSYQELTGIKVAVPVTAHYEGGADVLIDFSLPEGFSRSLAACVNHKTPFVSGTTGLNAAHFAERDAACRVIPLISAYNMSLGVNLLLSLVKQAAQKLGPDYDIEIVEMHHRLKVDAPSGTAVSLFNAACEATGRDPKAVARHGREGMVGPRTRPEIGLHAVRGGDVVGDHTVMFAGEGERIELVHKASSRDTFARGAVRAAQWLAGKPAGLYTMAQVLGL
ncbi:4-hydroxy-tetrahydrodipicolinate reductase [bacterium]|nr:MAG: 4-hydroxy-tetrahydrodipicolinate reductase [bacterium]RIK62380.1 MAG: 4-hydroxy-tetrahydrodipicolinate reductase [Planctomycetota bacterium]